MENETDLKPFKMKKRKLTRFLCEEMLYDFATDNLDPERRRAVSEFLKESKECQDELESLYGGIEFTERLSQTQISEPLFKKIRDAKSPLNEWLGKYRWATWPESIKWTVEAVGISVAVVLVFALISPKVMEYWPTTANQQLVLVEVDKKPNVPPASEAKAPATVVAANEKPAEKLPPTPEQKLVKEALTPKPAPVAATAAPKPEAAPKPLEPVKTPEVVASAPAPAVVAKAPTQTDEDISEAKAPVKGNDKGMRGFLYRAFMELEDLDVVTEKITTEITTLGGEKAGEVPLGWRKPKGSYYHFTLPEANYEQLITNLKTYGEVRLYKDPHPRVMPDGVIRLILSVEDARLKK